MVLTAHHPRPEDSSIHEKIQSLETTLTGDFKLQLEELRELQRKADERREQEEEAKRKEREEAAKRQEQLLEQLLMAQVSEAKERGEKQRTLNKILGALLAIVTSGSGAGLYLATRPTTDIENERVAAPVKETVKKQSQQIETRVEHAEKKIMRLGEIAVEQQVQLADGIDFIGAKIDAAHPRSANKVEEPETVKAAKRKAEAFKRKRGAEKMFAEPDSADPFAGL